MLYTWVMPFRKPTIITLLLLSIVMSCMAGVVQADGKAGPLPIFDAHIHYNADVWEAISPDDAIARLRALGIRRAMVSSTSDEGTQRLYRADPAFVVPVLRPYRQRGTLETWMYDESVIPYLRGRLEKYRYAAIGEFHIEGNQAQTPVVREVVRLAKEYDLILHVHSDARAVQFILEQNPDARILWAHAGFEDAATVRELLDKQKNLWADLSFRYDVMFKGELSPRWRQLFVDHADRFLLGMDTYEPLRWLEIAEVMQWQRSLLAALPDDVAGKIAQHNGEQITRRFDGR